MNKLSKVSVTPNLLTSKECDEIILYGNSRGWELGPSYVKENDIPKDDPDSRICYSVTPHKDDLLWLWDKVHAQINENNKYYQYKLNGPLTLYILKYPEGGHIKLHGDALHEHTERRKLTLSIQLSDPADYFGGELSMLGASDNVAPKEQGLCVMFPSFIQHQVHRVHTGERFSVIGWIEGKEAFK